MFRYNIRGENIEVTEAIRNYVQKRLDKLDKYFTDELSGEPSCNVNLKVYPEKKAKAEVTIIIHSLVLRAEQTTNDLYQSIDFVSEKLERQIRKYKTRINRRNRAKGFVEPELIVDSQHDNSEDEATPLVRTKRLSLKPMDAEEAILQMNLLGHDFFIFEDAQTNGTSIVYRRHDDKYGLIETDE
ncbi:ribosome hibernation-promoting factor, HPF/YfiA family [Xylocopilactobacillus apicola]|uniref:Ribosome hibernation promoting factor n=1 Tax=Xylocopilactobacillus apicola TaxID=2932184 RepID=A0AAU9DM22_9LACO|nr:ribosome-associated translation inhibitor RaiA [Xylocopilactobacillus apicola]BDR57942.1 sigma-54 modulation protein [Xylocopilactobacillus apicola]